MIFMKSIASNAFMNDSKKCWIGYRLPLKQPLNSTLIKVHLRVIKKQIHKASTPKI